MLIGKVIGSVVATQKDEKLEGRKLLERVEVPEPWRSNVTASLSLIDELERQIDDFIASKLKPADAPAVTP